VAMAGFLVTRTFLVRRYGPQRPLVDR
jgi:hypothetical protein